MLFFYRMCVFYDFINLTKVHNFTVNAQDIFSFGRLSLFTIRYSISHIERTLNVFGEDPTKITIINASIDKV